MTVPWTLDCCLAISAMAGLSWFGLGGCRADPKLHDPVADDVGRVVLVGLNRPGEQLLDRSGVAPGDLGSNSDQGVPGVVACPAGLPAICADAGDLDDAGEVGNGCADPVTVTHPGVWVDHGVRVGGVLGRRCCAVVDGQVVDLVEQREHGGDVELAETVAHRMCPPRLARAVSSSWLCRSSAGPM